MSIQEAISWPFHPLDAPQGEQHARQTARSFFRNRTAAPGA
ncbi:hypothetical protein GN109_12940 [Collimonas pratensis]|nr:hypothetical protein [Collimonas pratensis]